MKKILISALMIVLATGSLSAQTIIDSVLYIDEGTTQIKNSAYYGRTDFNKVVIPSSVTVINGLAFHNCTKLKEIEIPASVDTIGNAVFQNDSSLTKVTLHEGLTNLSYRLFKSCASLTEITIPSTVTKFGDYSLAECPNLTTIKVDKYSEAHAYFCTDSRLELTDNEPIQSKEQWIASAKYNILDDGILYVGKEVSKINDNQYKNNLNITEIRFSESLEKIGSNAFKGVTGLKKVVIPGNVKVISERAFSSCSNLEEVVIEEGVEDINGYAFYSCKKLQSVTFPKSIQKLITEGLFWETNSSIVFHCYAGSDAYNLAKKSNFLIDIIDIDERYADSITELEYSGNTVINPMSVECVNLQTIKLGLSVEKIAAEVFWNYPIEKIDLDNNLTEIGENAFNDLTTLRAKRNTYADSWAKENGYYLCGVLADLNVYTKDASKQIEEDFTRILCDDDSYANWTSYKFKVQQPLMVEEVDGNFVLTSFLLEPCRNVTVSRNGNAVFSNKTIQPLTRTVLCVADGTTTLNDFEIQSDDSLYNILASLSSVIDWTVSFNGDYIRKTYSGNTGVPYLKMLPVYCREWIATISNHAYVIASDDYENLCYEGVEQKWFVSNKEQTEFLTKEQMDNLLEKTRTHTFRLGHCDGGGLGSVGGNNLYLMSGWFRLENEEPHSFYHEFSHNMGYNHSDGNMCNKEATNGYGEKCWPMMGAKTYKQFFTAGELPYTDKYLLGSDTFSYNELHSPDPQKDTIIDNVLYIGEGSPRPDSHKNQTDFTKVEIPSSVSVIGNSAFYGTEIQEITIPSSVQRIEKYAFYNCSGLKSITIPSSVHEIGDNAFSNAGIDTIVIPESVTMIGKNITSKNVVWVVEKDSYAHTYAIENNLTFKIKNSEGEDAETAVTEQITNTNIYTVGKNIVVENATDEIRVYDAIGRLIARRDAMHCVSTIIVRYSGVYVVRIGNLAKKVIVE